MATTWPSITADTSTSGKGLKLLNQELFERDQVVIQAGMSYHTGLLTSTATVNTNIEHSQIVAFPVWALTGIIVRVYILLKLGGGATTVSYRLKLGATYGTTVTHNTTSYSAKESLLTLPDDGQADKEGTLEVALWTNAGTVNAHTVDLLANMRFSD